jgi:hypothetical protein
VLGLLSAFQSDAVESKLLQCLALSRNSTNWTSTSSGLFHMPREIKFDRWPCDGAYAALFAVDFLV